MLKYLYKYYTSTVTPLERAHWCAIKNCCQHAQIETTSTAGTQTVMMVWIHMWCQKGLFTVPIDYAPTGEFELRWGWPGLNMHFQITLLIGIWELWKPAVQMLLSGLISHHQWVWTSLISPSHTCSLQCIHIHWHTPNYCTCPSHLPPVCPIVVSHWQALSANKACDGST